MDTIYLEIAKTGFMGALVVVLIVWVRSLQDRLMSVIEKNTEAMAGIRAALEKCQMIHDK